VGIHVGVNTLLLGKAGLFIFGYMQRETSSLPFGHSEIETNPVFNVLIAYDDFEAGKHAKRTYDFLVENLGSECEFANQMWKFDVLGIPKLREMAARDVSEADIIMVSCHATGELSDEFKAWVEIWLGVKCNAIAMVVLLDCPFGWTAEAQSTRAYLAAAARRGGMEFFCEADGTMNREQSTRLSTPGTFSALVSTVERDTSFSRWGINE
jgi:hypothetical protein